MNSTPSFRVRLYRRCFSFLFSRFGRFFFKRERWQETRHVGKKIEALRGQSTRPCLWFHAASVGELESLWSVIELFQRTNRFDLVLTVFSSSAWNHLHRMARSLEGPSPLYAGYSPLEGEWAQAFDALTPALFVTSKYEAWPEMWQALAERDIALAILGAKARSSLLWAKRILSFLGGSVPRLLLFSFDSENDQALRRTFPQAKILSASDPRWDRAFQRAEKQHPRVSELLERFRDLPRPWGVIGSAWVSDILRISYVDATALPGTLWVVPHHVDARSISEIEILLRERGWTPLRTGAGQESIRPAGRIAPLVDEMGFLAELYSLMDWSWVGGGFGSGVHSTIEPAVYGIPVFAGVKGWEKFDEIPLLRKQGQITPFASEPLQASSLLDLSKRKEEWKEKNRRHQGASQRILSDLLEHLDSLPGSARQPFTED